ncbi:hypothetical protein [Aquilutibacter rugosus]|uniref:hypothetical protein n=1 Tax=Aquilutibacter rugosus TaxID=3115820 RepID=UPI002F421C26
MPDVEFTDRIPFNALSIFENWWQSGGKKCSVKLDIYRLCDEIPHRSENKRHKNQVVTIFRT